MWRGWSGCPFPVYACAVRGDRLAGVLYRGNKVRKSCWRSRVVPSWSNRAQRLDARNVACVCLGSCVCFLFGSAAILAWSVDARRRSCVLESFLMLSVALESTDG